MKESFCFCFWPDSPFVALIRKAGERPITPFGNVLLKGKPVEVDRFQEAKTAFKSQALGFLVGDLALEGSKLLQNREIGSKMRPKRLKLAPKSSNWLRAQTGSKSLSARIGSKGPKSHPKRKSNSKDNRTGFRRSSMVPQGRNCFVHGQNCPKDPNWPPKLLKSSRWLPKAQNGLKVPNRFFLKGAKARVFDS